MSKIVIDARESGTSTGRYVDKLIEYLNKMNSGHDIIVLTKPHRIAFFQQTADKFKVIESPYREFTFSEQLVFLRQIQKLKPDLVHFTMVHQPVLYLGKVVTTMQDLTTVRFKNPSKNPVVFAFKQFIYTWVNRIVAHKSSALIAPSEFVKEDIAKFARINSRKITVTLESADKITEEPEQVTGLEDSKYIMYVGRPQPHKNLYRLVTAFASLKKDQPDLKLVLAGKKDVLYEKLEDWVLAHNINDVVFTDFVSEGQLRWLYENTQAYVFPSLSEGFGLPPLEAMCHGAPVISSNATCLPEINGQAAYYFDPNDTKDMAAKINEVLTSKKLRDSLIEKGYEQVKKYSWKRMADQTLDVYEKALKSPISQ
jgi:glycosyltransferase involved in cell wall biosynthesis